jgi:hypothetical protein
MLFLFLLFFVTLTALFFHGKDSIQTILEPEHTVPSPKGAVADTKPLSAFRKGAEPKATPIPPPPNDPPPPKPIRSGPIYKNITARPVVPIRETFPLAAKAKSSSDLPPIPSWDKPPSKHVPEVTPLFIGFTRNWPLLQQAVVGYITAGWPPEDIYVVDNTGTMDANEKGQLSLQNPSYLDHHRLKKVFGVNVLVTPTLQSFAQLQNLYLSTAINKNWPYYFWSHMDVIPQSDEAREPFKSLYMRTVDILRETTSVGYARDEQGREGRWALRFFAYDWLTLMNTATLAELGGWDPLISYYTTDCDMYERMRMANLSMAVADAGMIYDAPHSLEDLAVLYRRKPKKDDDASGQGEEKPPPPTVRASWWTTKAKQQAEEDQRNSTHWHDLQAKLKAMQIHKNKGGPRNRWQEQQTGGQGEPYYRDLDGFIEGLEINIKAGVNVYRAKWGSRKCGLKGDGLKLEDAWKVKLNFDPVKLPP